MKRVIPFFHSEFNALQVSSKMVGEIPPFGYFGDFWWLLWLFSPANLVIYLANWGISKVHEILIGIIGFAETTPGVVKQHSLKESFLL